MNQVKEQSRSIQAALGGIGAVSLFVAAIGVQYHEDVHL